MRTVSYRLADLSNVTISLGFVGENEHTRVQFDAKKIFEQYPDAIPALTVQPPKGDAYPAVITLDGDLVIWDVSDSDLAYQGMGEIQLVFTEGETVAKSYIARTRISRSIVPTGEVPTPVENWMAHAAEVLEEVDEAIPTGGTTGQVLAKKSDADRDLEWVDQTGGGGTSNYNDLSNKPQIGGVTLSGNKTLHDLGAAAEEDIPVVHNVPAGGSANQVLAKASGTDYDLKWVNQSGGGGGGAEIDDTAGEGDTDVVWSADKTWTENEALKEAIAYVAPKDPATIPFIDNTWINSSGTAETDNSYEATDYIDLDGIVAIAYTGKCGSSRSVFWYDEEKNFLSRSLQLNDRMAWFENIMVYKPEDAAYVRIQSKKLTESNPPDIAPEVTAYLDDKYIDVLKAGIVGDGVTDDTLAVQKIVNMCDVVFPKRDTILISRPIDIRLGHARIIDGNGCNIVVDDDFCALSVTGTLNSASEATGMDAFVVEKEACTLIKNFRITAQDSTEGCGIELTKGFKTKLMNNYIHHMKNGIRVYGQNREVIISENNIFTFIQNGILFDTGVNLHQCNIVNNMIQYAHDDIHIYQPAAIANFQIVGNDIEIVNYPASTYSTATCINFEAYASTAQFSEIEISGNTIQGHQTQQDCIVLTGVADHEIKHMTITGNHISNALRHGIKMAYVENLSICGNNYTTLNGYIYGMDGECTNIVISGESAESVGGKIKAESTATLNGIKCKNMRLLTNDQNNILTSDATDVDIYDEKDIIVSGATPSITAVPNARYICGEVSSLSFTPCADGVCEVVFTSGSTPTTLTIPNTVKWSDDFDPTDLDASTTYELSVLNGIMGVAAKWA